MNATAAAVSPDARLSSLPRRVGAQLQRLRQLGHISDAALMDILDAGELAGDSTNLLAFAVAYLHLVAQRVPMTDSIRMAKRLGYSINLAWSERRWNDEHNRMSRAETLRRLASENVRYDLKEFEAAVPSQMCGYLIRSSRRLGMEGFRQRHCVASYDSLIRAGTCALASVFVDHRRWTVELHRTGNPSRPLRVLQIKTRFNEDPSFEARAKVRAMFGDMSEPGSGGARGTERGRSRENLRRVLPVLRQLGVRIISVSFDGCGDSGCIDSVTFDPPLPVGVVAMVEVVERVLVPGADGLSPVYQYEQEDLVDAVDVLVQDLAEAPGINWWDQDGGYGELSIDVEAGTFSLEISTRFTESSVEYCKTFDIETEEDITPL